MWPVLLSNTQMFFFFFFPALRVMCIWCWKDSCEFAAASCLGSGFLSSYFGSSGLEYAWWLWISPAKPQCSLTRYNTPMTMTTTSVTPQSGVSKFVCGGKSVCRNYTKIRLRLCIKVVNAICKTSRTPCTWWWWWLKRVDNPIHNSLLGNNASFSITTTTRITLQSKVSKFSCGGNLVVVHGWKCSRSVQQHCGVVIPCDIYLSWAWFLYQAVCACSNPGNDFCNKCAISTT